MLDIYHMQVRSAVLFLNSLLFMATRPKKFGACISCYWRQKSIGWWSRPILFTDVLVLPDRLFLEKSAASIRARHEDDPNRLLIAP